MGPHPCRGKTSAGGPNNDVAIIALDDQLQKGESSFGGTSTVAIRRALRAAAEDSSVRAIALVVCSPGGTVAGTGDLADDVGTIDRTKKPVFAFVEDMAASAAFWIASQCRKIFSSPSALIGSVGTYAVLEDTTGMQQAAGVKMTVVSTGKYKGLGADGKVTPELVADVQREIDDLNVIFLAALKRGRGLSDDQLAAASTGQVWIASEAKQMKLIDDVMSLDEALRLMSNGTNGTHANSFTSGPDSGAFSKAIVRLMSKSDAELFSAWRAGDETIKDAACHVMASRTKGEVKVISAGWTVAASNITKNPTTNTTKGKSPMVTSQSQKAFYDNPEPAVSGVPARPSSTDTAELKVWSTVVAKAEARELGVPSTFSSAAGFVQYRAAVLSGRHRP